MKPTLIDDACFEVVVNNDMVQHYMLEYVPRLEAYLRKNLHNRKIRMKVRVRADDENRRAYSHVERFQVMSEKNPDLLGLKNAFGLDLA